MGDIFPNLDYTGNNSPGGVAVQWYQAQSPTTQNVIKNSALITVGVVALICSVPSSGATYPVAGAALAEAGVTTLTEGGAALAGFNITSSIATIAGASADMTATLAGAKPEVTSNIPKSAGEWLTAAITSSTNNEIPNKAANVADSYAGFNKYTGQNPIGAILAGAQLAYSVFSLIQSVNETSGQTQQRVEASKTPNNNRVGNGTTSPKVIKLDSWSK